MQTILSDKYKNKLSKEQNKIIPIHLDRNESEVNNCNINLLINSAEVYEKEINESSCYRISANLNLIYSNILINPTGVDSFETITRQREFDIEDGEFDLDEDEVLFFKNGHYYYLTGETLSPCNKVYLEPKPQKLSLLSDFGKSNWQFYLTYPHSKNNTLILDGVPLSDGIKIYDIKYVDNNGRNAVQFFTNIKHNLKIDDRISILNSTSNSLVNDNYYIYKLGDENNNYKEYAFVLDIDIPLLPNPSNENISLKKIINNVESNYYQRFFKKITPFNGYDLYPTSFGQNLFEDRRFSITFTNDIDISNYTDYLDRPITALYLTKFKTQLFDVNNDSFWSNVSSGMNNILADTQYDINTIAFNNIESIESDIQNSSDLFFGDIIEFNKLTHEETILIEAKHRFNSSNRDENGSFEGYYYTPHQLIQLRNYASETNVNFIQTESPNYAIDVDGRFIWKEIDANLSTDLQHNFANGCHYYYNNFDYILNRQDPCDDFDMGIILITGKCEQFEDINSKIVDIVC
jgi:hypothetical protein